MIISFLIFPIILLPYFLNCQQQQQVEQNSRINYSPVVIWHGMGDSCCNNHSMGMIKQTIESILPGIYVRSIRIGATEDEDRKSTYFGNFNSQVEQVCKELADDEKLRDGFNAIGFSQGGQAMRTYVQRCNSPKVYNLITIGSQHGGVADLPSCSMSLLASDSDGDRSVEDNGKWCRLMRKLAVGAVYNPFLQKNIIQAQYFKNPKDLRTYLRRSVFLADINNEREIKNDTYKRNLKSLRKFVLIMFERDVTVYPRQSGWFWFVNRDNELVRIEDQPLWKEDWLGLRYLHENGRLEFGKTTGEHMQIDMEWFKKDIVRKYLQVPIHAPRLLFQQEEEEE